jgi:hypothetical protein
MTVTDGKKVLMKSLAHVWSQYKIVLILFICIMRTKTLSGRVRKPSDHIVFYYLCVFAFLIALKNEVTWEVQAIVVIDSLIGKRCGCRDIVLSDQTLNRS